MNRLQNPALITPSHGMPQQVAVIGAGTIGPDIGYYLLGAVPGLRVTLIDIREDALQRAQARIQGYVQKGIQKGKLEAAAGEAILANLHVSTDYAAIRDANWVLEAATEDLPLKRKIFAQIEALVRPTALITSNTSSIPAADLYAELQHPERATVTHFFAPAFQNVIVEVIDWATLTRANLDYLRWFFAATGKVPLVTRDVVCFMLDRIFDNWCNEAGLLLAQASAAEIDTVAQEFVAAGPFFVLNLANGNPIIIETNERQMHVEGEHYRPAAIFSSVERWRTVAPRQAVPVANDVKARIRDRLLGILYSQSVDIADREIGDLADLELGSRLAFGFKQGPLELLATHGESEARRILARLQAERPGMPQPQLPLASYAPRRRFVLVDVVDEIVVITIRRPEALNALHDELNDEILATLREFEPRSDIKGFVITGYGTKAFCSGADIGRFTDLLGHADAAADYARACSRVLVHLDQMTKPVVAALNGLALGGGLELAMRCHARVAVRGAAWQFPEITLGIAPGIGAMVVPFRHWPRAAAKWCDMLLAAKRIDTSAAAEIGAVDALVAAPEALLRAAIDLARTLDPRTRRVPDGCAALSLPAAPGASPWSATVQQMILQAVRDAAAAPTFAAALEIGYRTFGASACTAAAREGIAAFSERRPADFTRTG
jgi:enoyl-CoA hydratase/3-hydroxyacyl-CoA dehydrogenase